MQPIPETHTPNTATQRKSSSMRKWTKNFFLGIVLTIGLFVLTAVIIAAFFEKQVGERLISEINKQLNSELTVTSFDLSLLSSFPDASATLHGVFLDDVMDATLLEADQLSFHFGLLSLFGSMIQVHSMLIEDGALFIKRDKKGKANYDIIKKSRTEKLSSDSRSTLTISLEEAQLKDVDLIYVDERIRQEVKLKLRDALVSGEFSADRFSLTSFAKMKSEFVEIDGKRTLVNKDMVYDATIDVDITKGRYLLEDVDLGVESNVFKVKGMILTGKNETDLDLRITSEECSLATMFELLPEEQQIYFSDFESKGTFLFDAIIKGKLSANESPAIRASFGLENGTISSPKLGYKLKEVAFGARFQNGKDRSGKSSVFEVKDFKGYFNRELITGELGVFGFDKPIIDLKLDGVLPLDAVYGLLNDSRIKKGEGEIEIKKFKLRGRYADMIDPSRISKVSSSGLIEFDDAALKINNEKLIVDRGSLQILDNSIKMNNVKIEGAGSEMYLSGKFLNILPVLLADSLNSEQAEVKFQATLDAPNIDIDRLISMTNAPIDERMVRKGIINIDSVNISHTQQRERITNFLQGTFQAKIDQFNYRKIKGEDFSGSFTFDNNKMSIQGRVQGMDGAFNVDGVTHFEDKPYLKANLDCESVDVRKFFDQCENFGMTVLTAKNVKGTLNSKMAITAHWSEDGTFLDEELGVIGELKIDKGELINLEMLYAFAEYIKLRDLKHIKFTTLQNYIEIKKGKVYLPAMFLQSNALNLTVSGTHSFDNKIDYNIKVNAGQVIGNLFKKYDRTKRPIEAKRNGWFNLYYRAYGTVEKYKIKRDKYRVKKQFERSNRHKARIERALVKAFGSIEEWEEPVEWKDEVESNAPDPMDDKSSDDEEEYIPGFDDEPTSATSKSNEEEIILEEDSTPKVNADKTKDPKKKKKDKDDDEYIDW